MCITWTKYILLTDNKVKKKKKKICVIDFIANEKLNQIKLNDWIKQIESILRMSHQFCLFFYSCVVVDTF